MSQKTTEQPETRGSAATHLLAMIESLRTQLSALEIEVRRFAGLPETKVALSLEQWLRLHDFSCLNYSKWQRVENLLREGKTRDEILKIHPSWNHRGWNRVFLAELDRFIELRVNG